MLTTTPTTHFFQNRQLTRKNTNTLWAGVIAETLHRKGIAQAVISPGSRSAALTIGFAEHPAIECISVLDERSAGFFALGLAKQTKQPVAVIVTSGTAAANLYPSLIEARMTQVPLIIMTADRPPEMHHSQTRQTMDQQKLFGTYPSFYASLAMPELGEEKLHYLRQTISHAFDQALYPCTGPIHLNIPFDDSLAPIADTDAQTWIQNQNWDAFFRAVQPTPVVHTSLNDQQLPASFKNKEGLILIGPTQPKDPKTFVKAVGHISKHLGWPVLADSINPTRHHKDDCPYIITQYEAILRNQTAAESLAPKVILQVGQLPICKTLLQWIKPLNIETWQVDTSFTNMNALHQPGNMLHITVETLASLLSDTFPEASSYLNKWTVYNLTCQEKLNQHLSTEETIVESKISWLLSQHLPFKTPIFTTSSTPVRDMEWFWQSSNKQYQTYFNGGVNGIDGILSTALGIAHNNQPSILLTGDLSFLHDSNGLLIKEQFNGSLTIILTDNDGGGIFEFIPISQTGNLYEHFIATPQKINYRKFCESFNIDFIPINNWDQFISLVKILPPKGIRILYLKTNRKENVNYRQKVWKQLSQQLN